MTIQEELTESLKQLLEICRYKCSPSDEVILPDHITNEAAMIRAMRVLERAEAPATKYVDAEEFKAFVTKQRAVPQRTVFDNGSRTSWYVGRQEVARKETDDLGTTYIIAEQVTNA